MQLEASDDQAMLQAEMRRFFERESTSEVVREAEPLGFSPELWRRTEELGLAAMCAPAEAGGAGSDLLDAGLVVEQLGRTIAPIPLVEHLTATRALARAGAAQPAAGEIATLALRPARDAVWRLVPAGAVADVVVGQAGGLLVAARAAAPMTGPANHACAPIADRTTEDATVVTSDADQFAAALDDWKALTAWALVGVAARALELGVEYVNDRHQFGRPIGSFQSIQHGLADLVGMIDGARLLAGKAAWECDHPSFDDPAAAAIERGRLASMAFSFATETAKLSTARALHYHGGYGVMLEYDIQLLYRRARGWPLVLHDLDHELLDLADLVFGPTGAGAADAGRR